MHSANFSNRDSGAGQPSPFIGLNIHELNAPELRLNAQKRQRVESDVSCQEAVELELRAAAGKQQVFRMPDTSRHQSDRSHQGMASSIVPTLGLQMPFQQQAGTQGQPGVANSSNRPAVNAAARDALMQCITQLNGITPAAQATLLQLLGSMAVLDGPEPQAAAAQRQPLPPGMQQQQQPGSPVRSSSAASLGGHLQQGQGQAEQHVQTAAVPASPTARDAALDASTVEAAASAARDSGTGSFSKVQAQQQQVAAEPAAAALQQPKDAAFGAPTAAQVGPDTTAVEAADDADLSAAATASVFAKMAQAQPSALDLPLDEKLPALDGEAPGASAAGAAAAGGSLATKQHSWQPTLQPTRSQVTYKARAMAAAAGAVRGGAAGSTLRLAGNICRSSSGSLADALLSEVARAESGLATGLPRSDSLPDMLMSGSLMGGLSGGAGGSVGPADGAKVLPPGAGAGIGNDSVREALKGVAMMDSLKDLDFTLSGLPSLSFILEQQSGLLNMNLTADELPHQLRQQVQQLQMPSKDTAQQPAAAAAAAKPTPFQGHQKVPGAQPEGAAATAQQPGAAAAAGAGGWASRAFGRPPSFTFRSAVPSFAPPAASEPNTPVVAAVAGQKQQQPMQVGQDHHSAMKLEEQQQQQQQDVCTDVTSSAFATHVGQLHLPSLLNPADALLLPGQQQQPQQQQGHQFANFGAFGMQQHQLQQQQPILHKQQQQPRDTLDGLLGQVNQELMAEAGIRQYAALQFGTLDMLGTPTAAAAAARTGGPFAVAAATAGAALMQFQGTCYQQQWQQPQPAAAGGMGFGLGGWMQAEAGAGAVGPAAAAAGATGYAGLAGFEQQQQQQLPDVRGLGAADGMAGGDDGNEKVVRYSRVITCKTYLKRLNITQPMAEHLLPYHNLNGPTTNSRTAGTGLDADEDAQTGGKGGSSYESLFKEEVFVVDRTGNRYRVQYEGVCCNMQKHLRLTSGWRDFIRSHGVEVGDTIVFERRGDDRQTLYTTVVKGGGLAATAAAAAEGGVGTKRKRVARNVAVQRLE